MKALISLKIITLSFSLLYFNIAVGQKKNADFIIDSIFVYKDFNNHGTTAGLWHNHMLLDSTEHEMAKVNEDDIKMLRSFVSKSKTKKLYQTKYGGEICYLVMYAQGTKTNCVAMSNGSTSRLDDLTRMSYWMTADETIAKQLNEILK